MLFRSMLALTLADLHLFQMTGDLMTKNMDWPGAEEIAKRLDDMLPPQLQPSADGTKVDPQVVQAKQMMDQMASQMEQMSQQIAMLNHQNQLLVGDKEREWFDAQTKRMEVEGKIMLTDTQLQAAVRENLALMMGQGQAEYTENMNELESLEANLEQEQAQQIQQPKPQQGAPSAPMPANVGAMTRKPDVEALTGESKPGEQQE